MPSAKGEPTGFTLIEVLVVVVIVSILVAVGAPKYFRIVERARLTQAEVTLNSVRTSQERYFTGHSRYVTDLARIEDLDISLPGGPPRYGMKDFILVLGKGAKGGCADMGPSYSIMMIRVEDSAKVMPRYFNNYMMRYERCSNEVTFPGCPTCAEDFMDAPSVQQVAKDAAPPPQVKPPAPPAKLKEEDLRRLRRSLEDMDAAVRRGSIEELGAADGAQPITLLTGHLRAEMDPGLRKEIVQACARKSTAAVSCLTAALRDYEPEVRLAAARSIKNLAAEAAAPALAEALFDQEVEVRREAILALRVVQRAQYSVWQERVSQRPEKLFKLREPDQVIVSRALRHAGLTSE
ncbi:MAG: HEAT repeat domain-containing protein [Elusimicrobiota bacterium]